MLSYSKAAWGERNVDLSSGWSILSWFITRGSILSPVVWFVDVRLGARCWDVSYEVTPTLTPLPCQPVPRDRKRIEGSGSCD